jgi:hypothetical protein
VWVLAAKPIFLAGFDVTRDEVGICGAAGARHVTGTQVVTLGDMSISLTGWITEVFTTDTAEQRDARLKSDDHCRHCTDRLGCRALGRVRAQHR